MNFASLRQMTAKDTATVKGAKFGLRPGSQLCPKLRLGFKVTHLPKKIHFIVSSKRLCQCEYSEVGVREELSGCSS
jgi:hypothetical protein